RDPPHLRQPRSVSRRRGAQAPGARRGHRAGDPGREDHRRARARHRRRGVSDVRAARRGRLLRRSILGRLHGRRSSGGAARAPRAVRDDLQRSGRALLLDASLGLTTWGPRRPPSPPRPEAPRRGRGALREDPACPGLEGPQRPLGVQASLVVPFTGSSQRAAIVCWTPASHPTEVFMRLIGLAVALAVGLTLAPLAASAQPTGRVYRIGILGDKASDSSESHRWQTFRAGLQDRGWNEGVNIRIEYRWVEANAARLPELAADLVRLKPDLIATYGSFFTGALKAATSSIPIVFIAHADPVGTGHVATPTRRQNP